MGNVKIRYLCHKVDGDYFCGRVVEGLNNFSTEFSISCRYFDVDVAMNFLFEGYFCIWKRLIS